MSQLQTTVKNRNVLLIDCYLQGTHQGEQTKKTESADEQVNTLTLHLKLERSHLTISRGY